MSFTDRFTGIVTNQINTSIGQVRSTTANRLTNFITSALPSTRKIPGAAGAFLQREITSKVGDGVQQILGALDIRNPLKMAVSNPKIYANGVSAAKGVWSKIEGGKEPVDSIIATHLEPLALMSYTDLKITQGDKDVATNGATAAAAPAHQHYTPYAMDLFRLAPKYKFLFVVEFVFNGPYMDVGQGKQHKNEFALVVKDFERPKIKYDYEQGVNYYNFRTPVVKRVMHDPLLLKFIDDRQNVSMKFFHEYLKASHPLTSVSPESASFYEDNGMNWNSPLNSASSSAIASGERTIIKEIKVYHLYDFGAYMNVYHFTNPKIVEMNFDSWNMQESEGSELSASFAYDGLFMELAVKIDQAQDAVLATLSNAGQYPLHPMKAGGADITVQKSKKVDSLPSTPSLGSVDSLIQQNKQKAADAKNSLSPGEEFVSPGRFNNNDSLDAGEEFI